MSVPSVQSYLYSFDLSRFESQVSSSLSSASRLLASNRHPVLASQSAVPHEYRDKYLLSELLSKLSIASGLTLLDSLGVKGDQLDAILGQYQQGKTSTRRCCFQLEFTSSDRCSFLKETQRKVESATENVTEYSSSLVGKLKKTEKTVTTVTEYFWTHEIQWELSVRETSSGTRIPLQTRSGKIELMTSERVAPKPEKRVGSSYTVDLDWLLERLSLEGGAMEIHFTIDRQRESCRTPRRNGEIDSARSFFSSLFSWSRSVHGWLSDFFHEQTGNESAIASAYGSKEVAPRYDMGALSDSSWNSLPPVFDPVLPLWQDFQNYAERLDHEEKQEAKQEGQQIQARIEPIERPESGALVQSQSQSPSEALALREFKSEEEEIRAIQPANNSLVPSSRSAGRPSPFLTVSDYERFIGEERRTLQARRRDIVATFPDPAKPFPQTKLISSQEAFLLLVLAHSVRVCQSYHDSIDYIEDLLRQQLLAAIGKEVTAQDFNEYMRFHQRKLFRPEFQPKPFCYEVRRPDHYPEGTIAIEGKYDSYDPSGASKPPEAIMTHCKTLSDPNEAFYNSVQEPESEPPQAHPQPMSFPLSASTNVEFHGARHLHAFVCHSFEGSGDLRLTLTARARQFSGFIVLLGRISSASLFDPKFAFLVQNKEELSVPLMLEQIPSAKEFRDAIESLSPEQQRFAQAYRQMQLESSMFGMLIVQIKPQLEKLLNLPYDSLTKEIQLTQDLMELFIKYQIPSDLLSFQGEPGAQTDRKVEKVRGYVKNMKQLIEDMKKKQIKDKSMEADYAIESSLASVAAPRSMVLAKSRASPSPAPQMLFRSAASSRRSEAVAMSAAPASPAMDLMDFASSAPMAEMAMPSVSDSSVSAGEAPASSSTVEAKVEFAGPGEQAAEEAADSAIDFPSIPNRLDQLFSKMDLDGSVRATIINPGKSWSKVSQESLLSPPVTSSLGEAQQKAEKNRVFDLLDALSRSGALSLDYCELHVVLASTHNFANSILNTLIQDNINPIEKLERSACLMAATVQGKTVQQIIKPDQKARVKAHAPQLFLEDRKKEIEEAKEKGKEKAVVKAK